MHTLYSPKNHEQLISKLAMRGPLIFASLFLEDCQPSGSPSDWYSRMNILTRLL